VNDYHEEHAPNPVLTFIEFFNSIGFSLIIGGIVYFIIGSVASLVNSSMLEWTLCGSAHYWFRADWCSFGEADPSASLKYLFHRLLNVALPWFMFFWGFLLTAVCSIILRFFPNPDAPLSIKREDRRL
jgi:hypothetical protein